MNIIDKYLAKEYAKLFFLVLASLTSLFLIVELFERTRMFLSNQATLRQIASYLFFMLPMILSQAIPASVLLASLVMFSTLSKYNEILAIKANGISLYRASLPVIIITALICIFSFLLNEFITPKSNDRASHIRLVEIEKIKPAGTFKQNQIWFRGKNAIYNFKTFDPSTNAIQGVTILYFDKNHELQMRIDAEKAEWKDDKWFAYDIMTTRFNKGNFPSLDFSNEGVLDIIEKPSDFKDLQKEPEKMGYLELKHYIREIQSDGYDATRYIADLHGKLAFTLVSLILCVIGISFSLIRSERSGGILYCIGIGIIIGFSWWVVHAFALSLGRSGAVNPILSAWTANIIFSVACVYLFLRVKT